jgi:1,2-diacylglycerol 3-alpha-glucosyltransferase
MAQGTPVVAIAELGTKSILIEGQGALIAPDDVHVFADRLASVINNPQLRQQLSTSALSYVKSHWTARVQAEKLVTFYQDLLLQFKKS